MNYITIRISDAVREYTSKHGKPPTKVVLGIEEVLELKASGCLMYDTPQTLNKDYVMGMILYKTTLQNELWVAA